MQVLGGYSEFGQGVFNPLAFAESIQRQVSEVQIQGGEADISAEQIGGKGVCGRAVISAGLADGGEDFFCDPILKAFSAGEFGAKDQAVNI